MPMIDGKQKRAYNTGQISDMFAEVVYENDVFEFVRGKHEQPEFQAKYGKDRGEPILAYAVVTKTTGERLVSVLEKEKIMRVARSSGKPANYDPQNGDDWDEFWKKAALGNVLKRAPKSSQVVINEPLAEVAEKHMGAIEREDAFSDPLLADIPDYDFDQRPEHERISEAMGRDKVWPDYVHEGSDGYWVDSVGEIFDKDKHEWNEEKCSPACVDGYFVEKQATPPPAAKTAKSSKGFAEIAQMITSAKTKSDLNKIKALDKSDCDDSEIEQLNAAITNKEKELA